MCSVAPWTLWDPMDCGPPGSSAMGFFRQGYWSGLSFSPPGDLSNPGIEPASPASPALTGGFFTTWTTWEYKMRSPLFANKVFVLQKTKKPHIQAVCFPINVIIICLTADYRRTSVFICHWQSLFLLNGILLHSCKFNHSRLVCNCLNWQRAFLWWEEPSQTPCSVCPWGPGICSVLYLFLVAFILTIH